MKPDFSGKKKSGPFSSVIGRYHCIAKKVGCNNDARPSDGLQQERSNFRHFHNPFKELLIF